MMKRFVGLFLFASMLLSIVNVTVLATNTPQILLNETFDTYPTFAVPSDPAITGIDVRVEEIGERNKALVFHLNKMKQKAKFTASSSGNDYFISFDIKYGYA